MSKFRNNMVAGVAAIALIPTAILAQAPA
ncbi:MAG: hypothetical protein JWM33_1351, partial [Caulobacteraceae bacterium]|nr:hypothetical protein [Caulobacteraceae bacterium]